MEIVNIVRNFAKIIPSDVNVNIYYLFLAYTIFGSFLRCVKSEKIKKWSGSLAGIVFIYVAGGFFHLWHVVLNGIVGSFLVAYADRRSCHKVAFIYMFTSFTLYGVFQMFFIDEEHHAHNWLRGVQMTMICKIVGVAFEINDSYKIKESLKNGEKNISEDYYVDPNLSDILHYTFFIGLHGPYITYRTYNDCMTLPFSRAFGISLTVKKVVEVLMLKMTFAKIHHYWPLHYCLTSEFEQDSFLYQTFFILMQYQWMLYWLSASNGLTELLYTSVGIGAYPVQGINMCGHGPTEKYSTIKKTTYSEAENMQYDFKTIKTMDIWTLETTPWMSDQVMAWNKAIQYFMWKYVRQSLPSTGPLKKYRIFIVCLVSGLWHGVNPGCFIGLTSIPACVWIETPYKIIISEYLSGWRKLASLFCVYLFRTYIYGFAMMSLMLDDYDKIYKMLTSAYFMPVIVYASVHLMGKILTKHLIENKKQT